MRWAPELIRRMGSWHRQGQVELRWATTWCPFADQLEALWRWPVLERSLTEEEVVTRETATAAKLRAALDVVVHGRRLIWADDDAIPDDAETLARLRPAPSTSLLISPNPSRGLSRDDLDAIEAFIEESAP